MDFSGFSQPAEETAEETTETIIAAMKNDKQEMIGEISDVLYHLFVLMADTLQKIMKFTKYTMTQ